MRGEWQEIVKRAGFLLHAENSVTVTLQGGSTQVVTFRFDAKSNVLRATSIIAKPSVLAAAAGDSANRYAWERNRLSDLVGFSVDARGRLIGQAWIPLDGTTPEEFGVYVSELARVSDWHEFRLTGEDTF